MKKTVRFILILSVSFTITSLHAQEMNPQMEEFLARMDNSTLEELEKELDEGLVGLRMMAGFFENRGEEAIKDYKKEEERLAEPFSIDSTIAQNVLRQFDHIGFQQVFQENQAFVKFQKIGNTYWNRVWLGTGMEERFMPKTIYYKDGTSKTQGIQNLEFNTFFEKPWGKVAIIDSILMNYTIKYTKAYDSLLLPKSSKKVKYKDGTIKIERLEKNHLYLTISDAYSRGLTVQALNRDGKPLGQNSSSFSPMPEGKSKDGFDTLLTLLEDIQKKLKAKKFKDTESLKKHLLKQVTKIGKVEDKDGVHHKKFYFDGNINAVQLFIETEEVSETVSFIARNTSSFSDIILMQNQNENIFLDKNAKELFRLEYSPIKSLGSRYFVNDTLFYHLNLETKSLDTIDAIKVIEAQNNLAFIQKEFNEGFRLVNEENEQLSDIPFENIHSLDNSYAHAIAKDGLEYIIDKTGSLKKLDSVKVTGGLKGNRILAKKDALFGFLEVSGEVAVPFTYAYAREFSEGLAVVQNQDNRYGFIDASGMSVIPCMYERAESFENGIAFVRTEGNSLLINRKGEIVSQSEGKSYSFWGSGVEKKYRFGDKTYDAFGKLIFENNAK